MYVTVDFDQLKLTYEMCGNHNLIMSEFDSEVGAVLDKHHTNPTMEAEETVTELFYHPETGERISKNAYKKLLKGASVSLHKCR